MKKKIIAYFCLLMLGFSNSVLAHGETFRKSHSSAAPIRAGAASGAVVLTRRLKGRTPLKKYPSRWSAAGRGAVKADKSRSKRLGTRKSKKARRDKQISGAASEQLGGESAQISKANQNVNENSSSALKSATPAAAAVSSEESSEAASEKTISNSVAADSPKPAAQTSESNSGSEVKSGNVVVDITSTNIAPIFLGLAPRGVAVIEFPADDPVYKIYPGNEGFVTVDCPARAEDGRCLNDPNDPIVLRPGKNLHVQGMGGDNSTMVQIQRVSGIVVPFFIVPVTDIRQNANHIAVRYSVQEQIKARQKVGLVVNLAGELPLSPKMAAPARLLRRGGQQSPAPQSVNQLKNVATQTPSGSVSDEPTTQVLEASFPAADLPDSAASEPGQGEPQNDAAPMSPDEALEKLTVSELKRVGNMDAGTLRFGKPLHGLALATISNGARLRDQIVDVVAVRNTLGVPIRLVPDMPELLIENRAEKNKPAGVSNRLRVLHIATNAGDDNILQPGEIYYFAFAYEFPILGAKQYLRASFAQTNAADAPVTVELTGFAR
jgi:hypothetical protein